MIFSLYEEWFFPSSEYIQEEHAYDLLNEWVCEEDITHQQEQFIH